jgi:TRAP-type C4-dicarboxylate transport system permease small subunit
MLAFLDKKLEEILLVAALAFIVILVSLQVLSRYIFDLSLGWSEELSRYVLIWIAWIGTSYAIRVDSHIRVELIKKVLPKQMLKSFECFVLLIWFLFALFLAFQGTILITKMKMTGQLSPSIEIPMWILYLIVPLGGALMCLRLLQKIYGILRSKEREG